jgi:hypothetical protein
MRNSFTSAILALMIVLACSCCTFAQDVYRDTEYDKLNLGPGGPAPKQDFSGSWAGPVAIDRQAEAPPLTPLGQKLMGANKPEPTFHVASTNDSFATMPDRIVVLNQYQRAWREIWMDGRELPKNVGAAAKDAPDPRYYGYSVGHWEGDNTLVVETTGLDDRTWLTRMGYPHSMDARVTERFTRPDHNDLHLTITVDDPKIYTKPFVLGTVNFKWVPDQQLAEQLCVPSEMLQYLNLVGDPAGNSVPPTN